MPDLDIDLSRARDRTWGVVVAGKRGELLWLFRSALVRELATAPLDLLDRVLEAAGPLVAWAPAHRRCRLNAQGLVRPDGSGGLSISLVVEAAPVRGG